MQMLWGRLLYAAKRVNHDIQTKMDIPERWILFSR